MNKATIDKLDILELQLIHYLWNDTALALDSISEYVKDQFNDHTPLFNVIKCNKLHIEVFTGGLDNSSDFYEEDQHEHTLHLVSRILDQYLISRNLKLTSDSELYLISGLSEYFISIHSKKDHVDYN